MPKLTYKTESEAVTTEHLSLEEVPARLLTDYYVTGGQVYENCGSFLEADEFTISLKAMPNETTYNGVRVNESGEFYLEYRIYDDDIKKREIIKIEEYEEIEPLLPRLLLYTPVLDSVHYNRLSAEFDQDRNTYVIYLK